MRDSESLFSREEHILNNGKNILNQIDHQDRIPGKEFEKILKSYEKLYKKMKHLVKISDRQQSDLQKLNNRITRQNIELQTLNKEKTSFFINLAHEIKTPLTIIKNYLDKYIKEKGINNDLAIIRQYFCKLTNDIVNFLDYEKINTGQIFYNHNQIVHLSDILQVKVRMFQEISKKKNIKISASIDENIYTLIDPSAYDRIINNLIDNALKFTDSEGQIHISLKSTGSKIELRVKDTGTGISIKQQENIFKPYYQISHKKRNIQGIGMGLNIVKKIIDEVNGEISVKSREGRGCEFIIRLPKITIGSNEVALHLNHKQLDFNEVEDLLKQHNLTNGDVVQMNHDIQVPENTIKKNRLKEENIISGRYNIFIVEDNEDLLSCLQDSICEKYNVFYALNGRKALKKLKDIPRPDIILSDIMMDEMDGYEFYEKLNKRKMYNSVPFIFITARLSQEEKVKGIKKGAVDFINKPFDMNELIAKIDALISMQEAQKAASESEVEKRIIKAIRSKNSDNDEFYRFEENCRHFGLTVKEKEIATLILKGKESKEISYEMHISYNTVKSHIRNIYEKCQVQNRVELVNKLKNSI